MLRHSYSAIKDFQGCARRYQQVRILRRFKTEPTDAILYGERLHKAFEDYIMKDQDLPGDLREYTSMLDAVKAIPGQRFCEHRMGMRKDFSPCGFDDPQVWFRGIPDVMVINDDKGIARIVDWKSGKSSRFADTAQLELMAAMLMAHFPTIERVKAMLMFVVAKDSVKAEYTRDQLADILSRWAGYAGAIERAIDADVWNATPSGLCKFCPVTSDLCEHR
jgi:hypothetical protein